MRTATRLLSLACLFLLALPALAIAQESAATTTPVGTWQQVDDNTGKVTSILRIDQAADGSLTATVLKVMNRSPESIARDGTPPRCTQCKGERHDQPIIGMQIMWGVHKDGDQWDGGHILDPSNGKTYKVKLNLADNGSKLKVRGYVGMSLFGRTQVWKRATGQDAMAEPAPASTR